MQGLSLGRRLDWRFDPREALGRWPAHTRALLLHSGRFDARWARWSVLTTPVGSYRFVVDRRTNQPHPTGTGHPPPGQSQWIGPREQCPVRQWTHQPFHDLRQLLEADSEGIWVGMLGYDLGRWVEPLATGGPYAAQDDRGWPVIELGYCPGYLVYDGLTQSWSACGSWAKQGAPGCPDLDRLPPNTPRCGVGTPTSDFSRSAYERCVAQALDYIGAGDVFQVNLAQRFTSPLYDTMPGSGRGLYDQLAQVSGAWYGAYLELTNASATGATVGLGPSHRAIASASPELFLQVGGRHVVTRPIKGTRPGWVDPTQLRDSEKDAAELHMIIDLMRNDLGRVCDYGSVRVTQARQVESHPTVHHGVATVQGRLHDSKDLVDLLRAALPAGSITGAPKVRTMQIIDALEPVWRGPYCGCIGYLSRRSACLSVGIRTMLVDTQAGRVDFSVGGGIVADSQPALEYQETLDKAATIMAAIEAYQAIGTTLSG